MKAFADTDDLREAVGVFISKFMGANPGKERVVLAAVNVLSYGAERSLAFLPDAFGSAPQVIWDDEPSLSCCREVDEALKKMENMPAMTYAGILDTIPWAKLYAIALQILKHYWPDFPIPVPVPQPSVNPSPVTPG